MSVRLSNYWVPQSYELDLSVSLDNWSTFGSEIITCVASKATTGYAFSRSFTLHAGAAIDITQVSGATGTQPDGTTIPLDDIKITNRDEAKQTVTFTFDSLSETTEKLSFTVKYQTPINTELRGLYRCTYNEPGKPLVKRRMACTHFEPVGARLMYLCVDEPSVRVTFALTVRLPQELADYTVLSNGPLVSKETNASSDDHQFPVVFKFQPISAVPTYLTCLVIGDLEHIESTPATVDSLPEGEKPTPIRFYTVKGKSHKAQLGLDVARFSLHYFETFFQSKFPLPKLDLVAVPDFPIGGMENWGCICLTEGCLLPHQREEDNAVTTLKRVCNVVTHEVSHNWFGNLVGIDWWNGLWLKEGFATWCGIQGTIAFRPHLREEHSFYGATNAALEVDGFAGSHPIEVQIDDPADITQVFDVISYDKGMSVCNMLQAHLGNELFSRGLAAYVKTHAFGNTTTEQLWAAIEKETKIPVVSIMDSFTNQKGFPMVSVTFSDATIDFSKPSTITVSQEKFSYLGCPESHLNALWHIPFKCVVMDVANGGTVLTEQHVVLLEKTTTISIPALLGHSSSDSLVFLANPGGSGFYRVLYSDNAIAQKIVDNYEKLPEMLRRSFLNDYISNYTTGKVEIEAVVSLLKKAVLTEDSFANFSDALEGAGYLEKVLSGVDGEAVPLTLGTDLVETVNMRCESLTQQYYNLHDVNNSKLTPEIKLIRAAVLPISLSVRRSALQRAFAESNVKFDLSEYIAGAKDDLLQWAYNRNQDFFGLSQDVPKYTVTEDSIVSCLSIPLVVDSQPDYPAFAQLLSAYSHVESSPEKATAVLIALCSYGRNVEGLKKIFKNCARNSGIRSMYGNIVVAALVRNKTFSNNHLWEHCKNDWPAIFNQWGHSQFRIQRIIGALAQHCGSLRSAKAAQQWRAFFDAYPCPAARLDIERGYETILLRSTLNEKDAARFAANKLN